MEREERYILYGESTALILFFIAGLAANIPVLIVYFRSKHIRSITDKFLINLLIADLISLALLFPINLTNFIQYSNDEYDISVNDGDSLSPLSQMHGGTEITRLGRSSHSNFERNNETGENILPDFESVTNLHLSCWSWRCGVSNGLMAGVATASVLAALEIAMERYLAVVTPLHYHKFLTTPSIFITSVTGGFISIGSAVIASIDPTHSVFPTCVNHLHNGLEQLNQFNGTIGHHLSQQFKNQFFSSSITNYFYDNQPANDEDVRRRLSHSSYSQDELIWSIYTLIHASIFFFIPVILMCFIYLRIYIEARRQKIRIAKRYKPYFLPVPPDQFTSENNGLKGKNRFHPILIRFRLMDRLRATRVDRAARVAVFTLVVTILCWCPYYFVRGLNAFRAILAASGSQSLSKDISLDAGQYQQDENDASTWIKWECVIPILCASLHPILAPIFYAYRYKRLRTEIMKTAVESISSWMTSDKEGKTTKGLHNTTSTTSGGTTPCIRQAIITSTHPEITSIIARTDIIDGTSEVNIPILTSTPLIHLQLPAVGGSTEDFSYEKNSHISIDLDAARQNPNCSVAPDCNNDPVYINLPQESNLEGDGLDQAEAISTDASGGSMATGGVVVAERSVGRMVNCLTVWMNTYSRRWLQHRESVTSTASFITLISSKYHNKANPITNV